MGTLDQSRDGWGIPLLSTSYQPGRIGARVYAELASNENPCGASPMALKAAQTALSLSHAYPEHDAQSLRSKLAMASDIAPTQVLVGPGSTPLIDLIARTLLGPGKSAVVSERSFLAYNTAVESANGILLRAPMTQNRVDLQAVLDQVREDTRLIFLANPNNPTGSCFLRHPFEEFLDRLPAHVLVVLDEAYAEYAEGLPDGPALIREGRNVLVLRTFSKIYGLAGLRIGYAMGPAALIAALSQRMSPFAVSQVALAAASAAMDDWEHLERSLQVNRESLALLEAGLRSFGLNPAPTSANFLYVDFGKASDPICESLLQYGVRIRALRGWGAPTAARISAGGISEVQRLLAGLSNVLQSN